MSTRASIFAGIRNPGNILISPRSFLISSHLGNHTAAGFHIRQSGLLPVGISKWTMILLVVCYLWRWALVTADGSMTQQLWRKHDVFVLVLMFFCHLISPTADHFFYLYNNKIAFACFTLFPWQFLYIFIPVMHENLILMTVMNVNIVIMNVLILYVCIYFTLKKYLGIRFMYLNCMWYFHIFGLLF